MSQNKKEARAAVGRTRCATKKADALRGRSALRGKGATQRRASNGQREDAALEIMVGAAARLTGESVAEFKRAAILSMIEGAMDWAKIERGSYELPMTLQEREALAGLGKCQADYCQALKIEGALGV